LKALGPSKMKKLNLLNEELTFLDFWSIQVSLSTCASINIKTFAI
jgi:hypothetical protein